MTRKTRFVGSLLLAQSGCIAAGIWLQHVCISWSVRETLVKQASLTMASEAAALASELTLQKGSPVTPRDPVEDGRVVNPDSRAGHPYTADPGFNLRTTTAGEFREIAKHLVSPETGVLLADERGLVRFAADAQSSSVSDPVGEGYRLQWSLLNGTGASGGDRSEISNLKSEISSFKSGITLQLPEGPHFAVVKPLPSGDYLILHQSEATLEALVSAVLGNQMSVSLATLVWTAALLGVSGFLLAGRFHDQSERERSRSLNDALRQRRDLIRTRDAIIVGLAKLAESRDPETGDHLDRISIYATTLATAMMRHPTFMVEVTPSFVRMIGISAALHDIGKVGIADRILLKPGRLTAAERSQMEEHSRIGGDCLREIERRLGRSNFLQMAREIAFSHHERWDGSGYPSGLRGERIPLAARIVAIGDVYDALSSRRVYKEPLPYDKCVAIIREGAGTQFDPRIVEIWLTVASKFRDIAERRSNSRTHSYDEQVEDEPELATETCGSRMSVVKAAFEAPVGRG